MLSVPDPRPHYGLLAATAKVHGLTLVTRKHSRHRPRGV